MEDHTTSVYMNISSDNIRTRKLFPLPHLTYGLDLKTSKSPELEFKLSVMYPICILGKRGGFTTKTQKVAHSYTNGEGVSAQDRYRETKRDRQKGDADGDRSSQRKEWEPQLKKTRHLVSLNFLGLACETSLSSLLLNLSTSESQAAAFPWAVLTKPCPSHLVLWRQWKWEGHLESRQKGK